MENKEFITIAQLARILGVTRIAVFKKVKNGQIKAFKIGRNYVIAKDNLPFLLGESLSAGHKEELDRAVSKTVREYGETLKLLGRE